MIEKEVIKTKGFLDLLKTQKAAYKKKHKKPITLGKRKTNSELPNNEVKNLARMLFNIWLLAVGKLYVIISLYELVM